MLTPAFQGSWRLTAALVLGAVLGVGTIMMSLGSYLVGQYRELQEQAAAEAGGLYVEGFLAPHAHEFFASGSLSAESREKLILLLERLPVVGQFDALKIWDKTGGMIFSTDGSTQDEEKNSVDLFTALKGQIVVEIYTDDSKYPNAPIDPPYLEIYAPILDTSNSEIIAIGEVYQDATGFLQQRMIVERSIWLALGLSSVFGLIGLLLLIATQRAAMLRHLREVSKSAEKNRKQKLVADQARIEASQSNEHMLNGLGAELHDGPIQMLSLMMLMAGKDSTNEQVPPGMSLLDLGDRVMTELRAISTGLILPEIQGLPLETVLRLAVRRHGEFTGRHVNVEFRDLPAAVDIGLSICCYRFVQEGLTNGHRHSGSDHQSVSADIAADMLEIIVSDDGKKEWSPDQQDNGKKSSGIGLQGIRQRLSVFDGTLEIRRGEQQGTDLIARIPMK